jgi:hypothetical protein
VWEQWFDDSVSWVPKGCALGVANVEDKKAEESENRLLATIKKLTDELEKSLDKKLDRRADDTDMRMGQVKDMLTRMESEMLEMKVIFYVLLHITYL